MTSNGKAALVAGAGGFIGHHLVKYLKTKGYWVRGVDIKRPEFEATKADEFEMLDLRHYENCLRATHGMDEVYHLVVDRRRIGSFPISNAGIVRRNFVIHALMLEAGCRNGVGRHFYSSSAGGFPADGGVEDRVGKLYREELCRYCREKGKLETRIGRLHEVYGPLGPYEVGRDCTPAAICRKVAQAMDGDEIVAWGDCHQRRSFVYVDDCVEGIFRLTQSDHAEPLDIGTGRLITIEGVVDLVCEIAGKRLLRRRDTSAPRGIRDSNTDGARLREVLEWSPAISLEDGLRVTYEWIAERVRGSAAMVAARN